MLTTRRTFKLEFHRHVDEIMAGSFAIRQSKTILEISGPGFCDALAAERRDRAPTNLNMNNLTLCPSIGEAFQRYTPGEEQN
jgi:hypothetical protein